MNIAAIALDEKAKAVEPQAVLRTSLIRPDFRGSVGKAGLGLEPAPPKSIDYSVQRGDNLWSICRNCLRDQGQSPSKSELYEAVKAVAKANGLRNPDLLSIGQKLDLSAALGSAPASAPRAPAVIAKASVPPAQPAAARTSSIKTFTPRTGSPAATTPNGDLMAKAGATPAAKVKEGSSAAAMASSQQAAAKAAAAAFGGPDFRVLGATPPLVPADSVQQTRVASLPGSTVVEPSETKRPNLRSLMDKIGLGHKEARIGLASPWRRILDGAARITSGFGVRNDPFTGRLQHHMGLDIAAERGTKIFPMQDGEVTFAGWKGGYGRVVTVMHNDGLESTYGHNSKNLVSAGDKVTSETPLALVGSTGRSTGPHIHFEVRENGRPIDPMPLLEKMSINISEAL